jgi:hypothetical protein
MAEFIHLLNSSIVGYFVYMFIEHLFAIIAVIMFKIKKESCSTAAICREVWGCFHRLLVSTIGSLCLLFVNDLWSVYTKLLIT